MARVPAEWVNKLPHGLTPFEAITIGVAGYTAALAIDLMEMNGLAPDNDEVLVNGATGGVGSIAIDMLASKGYRVTAVTSKADQVGLLRNLGAADVILSKDLSTGLRPLESARWAAAVDSLGGEPLSNLIRTMQREGVIASIGNAAGINFSSTVMPFILRGVRLIGVNSTMTLRSAGMSGIAWRVTCGRGIFSVLPTSRVLTHCRESSAASSQAPTLVGLSLGLGDGFYGRCPCCRTTVPCSMNFRSLAPTTSLSLPKLMSDNENADLDDHEIIADLIYTGRQGTSAARPARGSRLTSKMSSNSS